ncbi:hypothetical protein Pmani_000462 [Petrolisthes manimaculis]|uniref:Uncharacterized protein n=1 Tax=Petrolisthes manimaculis TaxID=1843537 RepID=A0AAE1QMK6_9EUCA|nr:hypothetical protein Pmani_000462 [Petrolisthes manimaculis]
MAPRRSSRAQIKDSKCSDKDVIASKASKASNSTLGCINDICFASSGQIIALGCSDHHIRIWAVHYKGSAKECIGHSGSVNSVHFSPDEQLLASGSDDMTVKLWKKGSPSHCFTLKFHKASVHCVRFSPCGKFLASYSKHLIALSDVTKGTLTHTYHFGSSPDLQSINPSIPEDYILSSSSDEFRSTIPNDVQSSNPDDFRSIPTALAFNQTLPLLCVGMSDGNIKIFDSRSHCLHQLHTP